MTLPVSYPGLNGVSSGLNVTGAAPESSAELTELGRRFEQMLWTEMLSHAGLEEAFTRGGGEAAASFSRFVVEAIAKDLAERHPLGFAEELPVPSPQAGLDETK